MRKKLSALVSSMSIPELARFSHGLPSALDTQHLMLKEIMGDYVEPMYEILSNNDDPLFPKSCLDVGCGSGAW